MKTIWYFLRPYKLSLFFLIVIGIINGVLETLHVAVLYPILNGTLGLQSGGGGGLIFDFIGRVAKLIPFNDVVITYSIIFIILTVLFFLSRMIYLVLSLRLTTRVVVESKRKVFQKYMYSDYQFFIDNKQGELLYKSITAPGFIAVLLNNLSNFFIEVVLSVSIFFLLFSLSWPGAVIVIIAGAGYFLFTRFLGSRVSYNTSSNRRELGELENVILSEYISGVKPIKVFDTSPTWSAHYDKAINRFWEFWRKGGYWLQTPPNLINLALFSLIAVAVIIIKIRNPENFIALIPAFGTFAFAIFKLLPRLSGFGMYQMQIMDSLPNVEAVYEVLRETQYNTVKNGSKEFTKLNSCIEFKDVKFTHKNRVDTLENVLLKIEKGKTTAIVGASGTGKSTIVDLLLRLYDVGEGGIYVDSINIKEYDISSFLGKVGFVGQETFISNASVKDNICFGNEYTMEETINAAKLANADEFLRQLPEGYDTIVGDRGVRLSGGERQRIAIARAMIRKPQILVLDEATSSLDNVSESIVQDAINKVSRNCTTLIIAHRLQTIQNADVIYVLDKGKIIEHGTHDQLLMQKRKYWELYNIQKG